MSFVLSVKNFRKKRKTNCLFSTLRSSFRSENCTAASGNVSIEHLTRDREKETFFDWPLINKNKSSAAIKSSGEKGHRLLVAPPPSFSFFCAMWRGKFEWNPGLIVAQIVAIQAAFYASLGALLILLVGKRRVCFH